MGMGTWFKGLLNSESIVANISSGVDKAILTTEEKTEYFLKYLELSMPMNVTRRFIALAVTFMWLFAGLLIIFMILTSNEKLDEIMQFGNFYVMPPFTILIGFYFFKRLKQ